MKLRTTMPPSRRRVNHKRYGLACGVNHDAIHAEPAYGQWIRRYIRFRGLRWREELLPRTEKVERFLSDLAVNRHVAAATQNQGLTGSVP
jgi:hypothetical protein